MQLVLNNEIIYLKCEFEEGMSESATNWVRLGSNRKIWEFLRPVSVHFRQPSQNVRKLITKSHRFVQFGANPGIPGVRR